MLKNLAIASVVLLLSGCRDKEFPRPAWPSVQTGSVTEISGAGATFNGAIIHPGSKPILDHGFVWGMTADIILSNADKLSLGELTGGTGFSFNVNYGLQSGIQYFAKAFAITQDYIVYGNAVSFISLGGNAPVIKDFSPHLGTWGDTILITGKYFSGVVKNNIVKFGSSTSTVVKSTDSTLVCIVPENVPDKTVTLEVTVAGYSTRSQSTFTFISPSIESFSPVEGTFEDVVTIHGANFSPVKEKNNVRFNENDAEVIDASTTTLHIKVPASIRKKENTLSVTVKLLTGAANTPFTILPPSISSISSTAGKIGTTLQIYGTNFNAQMDGNQVLVEGQAATLVDAAKNILTIQIPDGTYLNRTFLLEVKVAEQTVFSPDLFTITDPWLRRTDVPVGRFGRYGAVSFSLLGKGYAGLGNGDVGNKFWQYDPIVNVWSEVASFPAGERSQGASFVIGNKAYVGLGAGSDVFSDFWSYDPAANSWTRVADFPYAASNVAGFSVNGKGYVVTLHSTDNFWEYDPAANQWTKKADVAVLGFSPTGFVINDKIHVYWNDASTAPNQMFKYDDVSNSWTMKAELDVFHIDFWPVGFAVKGKGYVHGDYYLNKYDPGTDSWQADLDGGPGTGSLAVVFVINGKVYLGGGFTGTARFSEFDPDYE